MSRDRCERCPELAHCRGHCETAGRRCAGVGGWNSGARLGAMLGPWYTSPAHARSHSLTGPCRWQVSLPSRSMDLGRVPVETSRASSGLAWRAPRVGRIRPISRRRVAPVTANGATDRIRPRGRPVPVAVDGRARTDASFSAQLHGATREVLAQMIRCSRSAAFRAFAGRVRSKPLCVKRGCVGALKRPGGGRA